MAETGKKTTIPTTGAGHALAVRRPGLEKGRSTSDEIQIEKRTGHRGLGHRITIHKTQASEVLVEVNIEGIHSVPPITARSLLIWIDDKDNLLAFRDVAKEEFSLTLTDVDGNTCHTNCIATAEQPEDASIVCVKMLIEDQPWIASVNQFTL